MTFDDLGHDVPLRRPARRVVSLVPSITEAIAASAPGVLVGATDWCTHPADLDVVRVRGTKNPDRAAITRLQPDLVVANQEENRRLDVDRLREAGVPVWVTRIDTVDEALSSLGRLLDEGLGLARPDWLDAAARAWAAPPRLDGLRVAVAIWRDPWLWVGEGTYAHDVLTRLGAVNVGARLGTRYPGATPEEVSALAPEVVALPDEPYSFTPDDGPDAFPGRARLVEGRPLFWYGPAMAAAPTEIGRGLAPDRD